MRADGTSPRADGSASTPRRARPAAVAALVTVALAAAGIGSAIRGPADRVASTDRDVVELTVDARSHAGRVRPIWDEVNVWKLHSLFGVEHPDPARWWGNGWLRARAPWVRYARAVAALGGNYAPAIAPWCDRGIAAPEHPDTGLGECGHDGEPGSAAANELVHDDHGRRTIDYAPWRTAIARLLASGVLPHVNLSAAPAAFTGDTDFSHYHWNAAPVRDLDAWTAFVAGAFTAVRDLDPTGWRVSIVNEPNCLTLVGWQQFVRHVGFAGGPAEYARMFVAGAAAVHAAAPGARVHAGNYVTSATFPGEDNLAAYLTALRTELDAHPEVRWDEVAATSVSLYETADTPVYEFVPVRLRRLRAALAVAGLAPRPVKVDELEILPRIAGDFAASEGQRLDTTLYAASWHAEALRQLVNAGDVVSAAPWLDRLFDLWSPTRPWAPFPKAYTYELFGLLAGQLTARDDGAGGAVVTASGRGGGLRRLHVDGERTLEADAARLRHDRATSLGALATRTANGVRLLVVHHWNLPAPDRSGRRRALARDVRVAARGVAPGSYAVRHLTIGGRDGVEWTGTDTTALRWHDDGCHRARGGVVELAAPRRMDANTVWLFDAVRTPRCPPEEPS